MGGLFCSPKKKNTEDTEGDETTEGRGQGKDGKGRKLGVKQVEGLEEAVNNKEDHREEHEDVEVEEKSDPIPIEAYHTNSKQTTEDILKSNGYKLGDRLGAGAFGTVYKVEVLKDKTYLACKVIEFKDKKKRKKRMNDLKNEIRVLTQVKSEDVVKYYAHFTIDEAMYIFMELAGRGTLSDHVRRKGPLRESRARKMFTQTCRGIQSMHQTYFAHRDIKLGNILIDDNKHCKVTDFGLSSVCFVKNKGTIYSSNYCGTETYMAPEIWLKDEKGRRYYDPFVADIWALGVCLYAMLNKAYPFNPEDKEAMLANQLTCKWKFVRKTRGRVSSEAKDLVRNLLEPDPRKRITFHGIFGHPWLDIPEDDQSSQQTKQTQIEPEVKSSVQAPPKKPSPSATKLPPKKPQQSQLQNKTKTKV